MRTALRLGLFGLCCLSFRVQAKGAEEADPSSSASPAAAVSDNSVRRAQAPARPPTPPLPSPVRPAEPVAPTPVPPAPPSAPTARLFEPTPEFGPPAGAGWPQAGLTSLGSFSEAGIPQMLGDLAPMVGTPKGAVRPPPWVRGYKMADNQSPRPQDRLFVAFNFYDNLRQPPTSKLREVKVYREFFGFEKTFFNGNASLGVRVPLNTLSASGVPSSPGGTSTALGDLTIFLKAILFQDREAGFLLSGGLAVTPPTGPSNFAGAHFARSIAATSLQPFLGYIWSPGRWFLQGFSGINVPTDPRVVTMYYNDVGIGYALFRTKDPSARLVAVVPTFEVHVNTPLNHRVTRAVGSLAGTPDVVDLTFGSSFVLRGGSSVSAGIVNPVTGPRPYDLEVVVLLNVLLGRRRATPPTPPPVFGS